MGKAQNFIGRPGVAPKVFGPARDPAPKVVGPARAEKWAEKRAKNGLKTGRKTCQKLMEKRLKNDQKHVKSALISYAIMSNGM